jgi:hypothetical protein
VKTYYFRFRKYPHLMMKYHLDTTENQPQFHICCIYDENLDLFKEMRWKDKKEMIWNDPHNFIPLIKEISTNKNSALLNLHNNESAFTKTLAQEIIINHNQIIVVDL